MPVSSGSLPWPQHEFFNRGKGLNEEVRERLKLPAIVESGRCAMLRRAAPGRSLLIATPRRPLCPALGIALP